MAKTSGKATSSYQSAYPGSNVHDRPGDLGSGFDLRETLVETKVRETSFAEFLAELKKAGKQVG